jgi:hypothetical protein
MMNKPPEDRMMKSGEVTTRTPAAISTPRPRATSAEVLGFVRTPGRFVTYCPKCQQARDNCDCQKS